MISWLDCKQINLAMIRPWSPELATKSVNHYATEASVLRVPQYEVEYLKDELEL